MKTRGSTSFLPALEAANTMLTDKPCKGEKLNLIFLTDGGDDKVSRGTAQLNAVKEIWEKHRVRMFALGFGEGHDKKTLQAIVTPRDGKTLNATYHAVASGAGTATLPEVFSKIFGEAVENELRMDLHRWSLDGKEQKQFTGCNVIGRHYGPWAIYLGPLKREGKLRFVLELPWETDQCLMELKGRDTELRQRFLIDLKKIAYSEEVHKIAEARRKAKNRT